MAVGVANVARDLGAVAALLATAFFALAVVGPAAAGSTTAQPTAVGYNLYFGDLHAHTGYSDGASGTTAWDVFPVASESGADFMALPSTTRPRTRTSPGG